MRKNFYVLGFVALFSISACKKKETLDQLSPNDSLNQSEKLATTDLKDNLEMVTSSGSARVRVLLPNVANYRLSEGIITLPYQGGNGGNYGAMYVPSSGVSGLTLYLAPGNVVNGNFVLTFQVQGKANGYGTASFTFTFGGVTTTLSMTAGVPGKIGSIGAASYPTLLPSVNLEYSSWITYPISNLTYGNLPAYSVGSTGVNGLTLSVDATLLTASSRFVNFRLTGTPDRTGVANFAVRYAGLSFNVPVTVNAGPPVYISSAALVQVPIIYASNVYGLRIQYSKGNGSAYGTNKIVANGIILQREPGTYQKNGGTIVYSVTRTTGSLATINYRGLPEAPNTTFPLAFAQLSRGGTVQLNLIN